MKGSTNLDAYTSYRKDHIYKLNAHERHHKVVITSGKRRKHVDTIDSASVLIVNVLR